MKSSKIYLSQSHMSGHEQKYIQEVFNPNWINDRDYNLASFEKVLENYLENNSFVGVLNSGTAAIHLGLIVLGVKTGDEVICQSMTFSASANPIIYVGATPIFIDSEPETWNLCPKVLEKTIIDRIEKGNKPKAIIAVHLYGVPYKVEEIHAIAAKYEIPILEDSAEALGSSYKGQKCGTFGEIGVLSFNGNKIITTTGGGAIITKAKEVKDKAIFFATQARDEAPYYQHSEIGYNYRMSAVCAGIGRGQMEVLNDRIQSRKDMHRFYVDVFKNIEEVTVFSVPNEDYFSNYWLTTILIEADYEKGIHSEALRLAFEEANIESRPLWKPMHLQPVFEKYPYYGEQVAENLFKKGLCLPSGSNLTDDDRDRITKVVNRFFK